jgi:hypothetical protein
VALRARVKGHGAVLTIEDIPMDQLSLVLAALLGTSAS